MSFMKFKVSEYVTFYDLPEGGAVATVIAAREEMKESYRTHELEPRLVLQFAEFKPLVCTNKNVTLLQEALPNDDEITVVGKRIWLMPEVLEVANEKKYIVRVHPGNTLRMQPDPTQQGNGVGPVETVRAPRVGPNPVMDDEPPPHTDADAVQPPLADDIPF